MNRGLGPYLSGIDGVTRAVDDEFVDAVLYVMRAIRHAKEAVVIGFILGEQHVARTVVCKPARTQLPMPQLDGRSRFGDPAQMGTRPTTFPGPRVPKPDRGKHIDARAF